jgi:hypothetical protein
VPDLPRNAMGKVQKNLLRDQHKACSRSDRRPPAGRTLPALRRRLSTAARPTPPLRLHAR